MPLLAALALEMVKVAVGLAVLGQLMLLLVPLLLELLRMLAAQKELYCSALSIASEAWVLQLILLTQTLPVLLAAQQQTQHQPRLLSGTAWEAHWHQGGVRTPWMNHVETAQPDGVH